MIRKILLLLSLYLIFLYIYTWRNILVLKDITYPEKNLYKDEIKTGDIFLLGNKKKHKIFGDSMFMIKFIHLELVKELETFGLLLRLQKL